jgi:hypothetical protein
MRGAGTVPGDRLSSSVVEIEPDQGGGADGGGAEGGGAAADSGGAAADADSGGGGAPAPPAQLRRRAVVNGVLPIASDDATYHAFKQRGMLYVALYCVASFASLHSQYSLVATMRVAVSR